MVAEVHDTFRDPRAAADLRDRTAERRDDAATDRAQAAIEREQVDFRAAPEATRATAAAARQVPEPTLEEIARIIAESRERVSKTRLALERSARRRRPPGETGRPRQA
jgi:hypothetical protein